MPLCSSTLKNPAPFPFPSFSCVCLHLLVIVSQNFYFVGVAIIIIILLVISLFGRESGRWGMSAMCAKCCQNVCSTLKMNQCKNSIFLHNASLLQITASSVISVLDSRHFPLWIYTTNYPQTNISLFLLSLIAVLHSQCVPWFHWNHIVL